MSRISRTGTAGRSPGRAPHSREYSACSHSCSPSCDDRCRSSSACDPVEPLARQPVGLALAADACRRNRTSRSTVSSAEAASERGISRRKIRKSATSQGFSALASRSGDRRCGGDGLQDRRPLVAIERAADLLALGQQQIIFDVEQARGVVAALDRRAEPHEPAPSLRSIRRIAPSKPRVSALSLLDQVERRLRAAGLVRSRKSSQARLIASQASRSARCAPRGHCRAPRRGRSGSSRDCAVGQRQVAARHCAGLSVSPVALKAPWLRRPRPARFARPARPPAWSPTARRAGSSPRPAGR